MSEKVFEKELVDKAVVKESVAPVKHSVTEQLEAAQLQAAQLEIALKNEELTAKRLEIQERLANIDESKKRQSDREIKRKQAENDLKQKARVFGQQRATDTVHQSICSHRKGGMAHARDLRVLHEGGDSDKRSIIRHRMINGDMWIRCTRCRKTWAPPIEKNFYFDAVGNQVAPADGAFDKTKFMEADREYREACKFTTTGAPSSSVICSFHKWDLKTRTWVDGNKEYRDSMASTNLR
jgi:hypothetical protein